MEALVSESELVKGQSGLWDSFLSSWKEHLSLPILCKVTGDSLFIRRWAHQTPAVRAAPCIPPMHLSPRQQARLMVCHPAKFALESLNSSRVWPA